MYDSAVLLVLSAPHVLSTVHESALEVYLHTPRLHRRWPLPPLLQTLVYFLFASRRTARQVRHFGTGRNCMRWSIVDVRFRCVLGLQFTGLLGRVTLLVECSLWAWYGSQLAT
jgi:hypothetical protein